MTPEQRLRWIYESKTADELSQRYSAWADDYDQHLEHSLNYIAPAIGVERFARHVAQDALILDAGAGTGLVGQRLHEAGFHRLAALDYSPGMLAKAREKGVYQEFYEASLADPLDFETGHFDAVISIGVFTHGHAPAQAFDELIRITRAGGIILFTVLSEFYQAGSFREYLDQLTAAGKWTQIDASEPFRSRNNIDSDASGLSFTYQVT